jgi:hypothetical protein
MNQHRTIEERVEHLERFVGLGVVNGLGRPSQHICVPPGVMRKIQIVQREVAREFGMTSDQLMARSRRHEVVWPRMIAMTICYEMDLSSARIIGMAFGRDGGTVRHARNKVMDMRNAYPKATEKQMDPILEAVKKSIASEGKACDNSGSVNKTNTKRI